MQRQEELRQIFSDFQCLISKKNWLIMILSHYLECFLQLVQNES